MARVLPGASAVVVELAAVYAATRLSDKL